MHARHEDIPATEECFLHPQSCRCCTGRCSEPCNMAGGGGRHHGQHAASLGARGRGARLEVADAVVHGQRGQVRARQVDGAWRVVVLHQPAQWLQHFRCQDRQQIKPVGKNTQPAAVSPRKGRTTPA